MRKWVSNNQQIHLYFVLKIPLKDDIVCHCSLCFTSSVRPADVVVTHQLPAINLGLRTPLIGNLPILFIYLFLRQPKTNKQKNKQTRKRRQTKETMNNNQKPPPPPRTPPSFGFKDKQTNKRTKVHHKETYKVVL